MDELEKTIWEAIKKNWWQIGILICFAFNIYSNDAMQAEQLAKHDNRISALEQKQNDYYTQLAVLNVNLAKIQSDILDIKEQLKGTHERKIN